MGLLDRIKKLAASAPETLKHDTSTTVILPNTLNEFLFRPTAQLAEQLGTEKEELVALRTKELVLIEARHFEQVKAGTDDDVMLVVEFTIAAPDTRLLIKDGDAWVEAPFYEECAAFARQTPVIHGQHMRADAGEIARFRDLLREAEEPWQNVELGNGMVTRPVNERRKQQWHLGAPVAKRTASYGDRVEQQIKTGLPVNKLSIQPRQPDGDYDGFVDFASAMFRTFVQVIEDSASDDKDTKAIANRLVSSLTGISSWTGDDGKPQRSPMRASTPALTVNEEVFNFWSTVEPKDGSVGASEADALIGQ